MTSIRLVRVKVSNTNTLGPGDQLVHTSSHDVVFILERSGDDDGWRVERGRGITRELDDRRIEEGVWMLLPRKAGES